MSFLSKSLERYRLRREMLLKGGHGGGGGGFVVLSKFAQTYGKKRHQSLEFVVFELAAAAKAIATPFGCAARPTGHGVVWIIKK